MGKKIKYWIAVAVIAIPYSLIMHHVIYNYIVDAVLGKDELSTVIMLMTVLIGPVTVQLAKSLVEPVYEILFEDE